MLKVLTYLKEIWKILSKTGGMQYRNIPSQPCEPSPAFGTYPEEYHQLGDPGQTDCWGQGYMPVMIWWYETGDDYQPHLYPSDNILCSPGCDIFSIVPDDQLHDDPGVNE